MLSACQAMLRPIVRMLLRNGVMWKEFSEMSRGVYVDVAGTDYGISGRPTNASRVSLLTGLTRREVRKQRDLLAGGTPERPEKTNNAMRLLAGWYKDPDFRDEDGQPRPIVREGDDLCFAELHRRYGGDIPAVAMLKELISTGSVVATDAQKVVAVSRYYMPDPMDPEAVTRSGSVINDLGTTVAFYLARESSDRSRFEGRASGIRIPADKIDEYRDFLETQGQAFLERVDDWLESNEMDTDPAIDGNEVVRLGVGVYMIQDKNEDRGNES